MLALVQMTHDIYELVINSISEFRYRLALDVQNLAGGLNDRLGILIIDRILRNVYFCGGLQYKPFNSISS